MTVCFPPLIKPDGRFSEFLCRKALALQYRVICGCRTFSGAGSPPAGRHRVPPRSSPCGTSGVPSHPPRVARTQRGPARDQHYYERLRLLPRPARPRPLSGLRRRLGLLCYPPWQTSPLARAPLPDMSPTQTPLSPLLLPTTVGLEGNSAAFAISRVARLPVVQLSRLIYVVHLFIATCRFDSTPAPHPASRRCGWRGLRC